MVWLFDANVLIALLDAAHLHHARVETWLTDQPDRVATCPMVQGSFVRYAVRQGQPVSAIQTMLTNLDKRVDHEFWPDELSYAQVNLSHVIGHRQVSAAYLVSLVQAHGPQARLATLDEGLVQLYPDVAGLVGVPEADDPATGAD